MKMELRYSKEETTTMIASQNLWFHQIDVGHGLATPGSRDCSRKLKTLNLPENLKGWTVLDIGANDGFYSFECEERGASSVLATDYPHWTGDYEYVARDGPARKEHFEIARKLRGSRVNDKTISVYDLDSKELGTFNLVMMYGVLYHLAHPTVGLEKAIQMSDRLIIVESALHAEMPTEDIPLMFYTPGPSSWWYPNAECIKAMMLLFGCEVVKIISGREGYGRTVLHGYKNGYTGEK